ncbi:ADM_HP2_G0005840.mRNA.1.CDS.1 [Saccharomyces cerevisiae]|nr:ADM_HP2_G0005840.mRNA.1.CDS.1 [Saccharomyces cerevisiae]CAI6384383.1 ADM_HP2_G0005840.mRNA.1.CDS.1 [Saccharomyces cerevisiae]
MRSIENDRSNYQLTQKNKSADGLVFNVVTQDMINKSTKPYRGHRFTKENVRILESWFVKNTSRTHSEIPRPREIYHEEKPVYLAFKSKTGFRIEEEKKKQ